MVKMTRCPDCGSVSESAGQPCPMCGPESAAYWLYALDDGQIDVVTEYQDGLSGPYASETEAWEAALEYLKQAKDQINANIAYVKRKIRGLE